MVKPVDTFKERVGTDRNEENQILAGIAEKTARETESIGKALRSRNEFTGSKRIG